MKGSFTGGFPARRAAGRPYPAPNVCSGLLDPRLWSGSYTGPPATRAEALDRGRSSAAISDLAQARRGGSWQCLVAGPADALSDRAIFSATDAGRRQTSSESHRLPSRVRLGRR
jgi:hypothetical protein